MSEVPEVSEEEYVRPRRVRRKKTPWEKFKEAYLPLIIVLLAIILVVTMIVGIVKLISGSSEAPPPETTEGTSAPTEDPQASAAEVQDALNWAEKLAVQYDYDGAVALLNGVKTDDNRIAQAISDYSLEKQTMLAWADNTQVPMISFQPLIVDTSRAFDKDENASSYNKYNLTVDEYREILRQLYENDYVLVSLTDLASAKNDGTFSENVIYLPEGKKPLVLSLVAAHYTNLQAADGFARRITLDDAGNITSEYVDADGKVTGNFDFVTILEEFLAEHPDFSYRGSRAILAVNGDVGPLGYKLSDPAEASQCKSVADALKNLGYQFASFSYDGVKYGSAELSAVKSDIDQWANTYSPILGQTQILIYVGGSDLDEYTGDRYAALYGAGFRYFCCMNNDVSSWGKIEDDYLRIARRTINGTRIMEDAKLVADLFDAKSVVSGDRP